MADVSRGVEDLMDALVNRVRFLSTRQIQEAFWPEGSDVATLQRLRRLCERGWVERLQIVTHPQLPLEKPLYAWQPTGVLEEEGEDATACLEGRERPDSAALSYQCRRRFHLPLVSLDVWCVTPRQRAWRGGLKRPIRRDQTTHDLHVGLLYARLFRQRPEQAHLWRSEEEQLSLPGERLPDALLVDETGNIRLAIEFGGACKPERIDKLHAFSQANEVGYELW